MIAEAIPRHGVFQDKDVLFRERLGQDFRHAHFGPEKSVAETAGQIHGHELPVRRHVLIVDAVIDFDVFKSRLVLGERRFVGIQL